MKKLTLFSNYNSIPIAINFVNEYLKSYNLTPIDKIDIVIDEVLSNIVKYAYNNQNSPITLSCYYKEQLNELSLKFIDEGIAYNPLLFKGPNLDLPVDQRKVGELGLLIVKHFMDEIAYLRENKKNILTLKKVINQ